MRPGLGLGVTMAAGVAAEQEPAAPENVVVPSITGTARVGETLTGKAGTWTGYPVPQFTFQWNRDGSPIEGAQAATYELGEADYGAVITVTVTATNSEGSASETSTATAEVAGIAPANVQAPQVSGVPEVGRELSVTEGEWTGFPEPTIAYQWMRDSEPIEDADAATYALVSEDEGAMISCRVTATNDEGSAYVDAEEVGPVAASSVAPPSSISKPTISGTAKVGETLTASAGVWAGNPEPTYAYQWNRDGDPISGAESSTYALIADDFDAVITVTVTATNSEGEDEETSDGTDPVAGIAPANTAAPSISGTATVGETLTASAGTWTGVPTPSYSYQWKRDGVNIGGATNATYQLAAADYDAVITVTVTATNAEGASSETSAGTSAVAGLAPVNTAAPVISGTAKVGESLSVTTGTWTGVPTPSYSYQWKRDGVNIGGATNSSYQLAAADYDAVITVTVTATNAEGASSETSAGTSAVAGLAPVNTAAPVISGTAMVGQSLSVTTGTWTGVPTPSISYQWTRDESDISGATDSTYTLIEDDEDAMIGCRVTATNAEGSDSADAEEVGPVEEAGYVADPNHFGLTQGWANTQGHLSGPGGTYDILKVTTLAASGPGSLKAALEASGARLIVFEVSGVIDLAGAKITVTNPYVTVAGQTAPSPGVAIIKGQIENATHDAIYRHLSFFAGTGASSGQDCFATTTGTYKTIIDHCAFFWGRDGNLDISGYGWNGANVAAWRESTSHEVTVSACVIAENFSSGGMLISDNTTKILTTRNYFYACRGRNGHFKGGVHATSANNLIYNPEDKFFDNTLNLAGQSGDSTETYESYIDLIGNVCKAGPDTTAVSLFRLVSNEDVNLYLSDNEAKDEEGDDYPDTSVSTTLGSPFGAINTVGSPSNTGHGAAFMAKGEVVDWIKANVGPRPWDRDAHIQRVLDHYDAGTGAHISDQSSVGGYPSLAENTRAFDADDWDVADPAVPPLNELVLSARRYPTLIAAPTSQYAAISQSQPALKTPVRFGDLDTVVVRITDASMAHHYSTWQAFNADQSMVLLWGSGGTILDTSDWSTVRTGFDPGFVVCFWDPVDPDIIWGHDGFGGGNGIYRYSVSENDDTRYAVPAASGSYNGISIGAGEGSISADGKYLVLIGTKSGSDDRFVIVWDAESNEVEGTLTLSGWGSDLDNAMISPSGDWIVLASLKSGERGHRIYDRATLTFQRAYTGGSGTNSSNGFTGHMDIGYRTDGSECMVRQRNDGGLVSVRLSDGNERLEIPGSSFSWGNHISCRNLHRPGYAYVSMSYQSDQTTKPLYREIFSVKLNGEGEIERWGQAMFPNSGDYDLQAKAVASPYGDMVLFTSGWGTTTPREYVMYVPETLPEPEPVTPEAKAVGRGTVYDTGTSITTSAGTTAESGSSFLLLASWEEGPAPTTVTDTKGNTYTLLGSVQNSTGAHSAAQYLCVNGVGGAGHTATISFDSAGVYGVAHLIEIVGCTSNPLDKHVQGTDGSSPYTVTSGTLSQADEVVVAFFAPQTANSNTIHQSSNTTIISAETNGANFWASAVGATVVSSTNSIAPSFTANGLSGTAYLAVMTFKVA